jgi:hypothetical protein
MRGACTRGATLIFGAALILGVCLGVNFGVALILGVMRGFEAARLCTGPRLMARLCVVTPLLIARLCVPCLLIARAWISAGGGVLIEPARR